MALQSSYALYIVRYDTILRSETAYQFYCPQIWLDVCLIYRSTRRLIESKVVWRDTANICAVFLGIALTLVSSAAEVRFALLLVLMGAARISTFLGTSFRIAMGRARWWVVTSALVFLIVLALGNSGLDHPAPREDVNPGICGSA